jgi:hypothetical protein
MLPTWTLRDHLPRAEFVALLKRLADRRGAMVGNSSAGLIEAAHLGLAVVNVGPRQRGRERAGRLVDVPEPALPATEQPLTGAIGRALDLPPAPPHPYGKGDAGPRAAEALARTDPHDPALLRKLNTY